MSVKKYYKYKNNQWKYDIAISIFFIGLLYVSTLIIDYLCD